MSGRGRTGTRVKRPTAKVVPSASTGAERGADEREEADGEDESEAETSLVEVAQPELLPPREEREPDEEEKAGRLAPLRSPVQKFLSEARRFPRLDEEQERELIRKVREEGDSAAARTLVLHNLRL